MQNIPLAILFILSVFTGCYAIPSYDPQYYGGMAEVSLHQEDAMDDWNGALSEKKISKEKTARKKTSFFNGLTSKKETKDRLELSSWQPDQFYPDNKFFPPEKIESFAVPAKEVPQVSTTVAPALKIISQSDSSLLTVDPVQIQSLSLTNGNIVSDGIRQVNYSVEKDSTFLNPSVFHWKEQTSKAITHLEKEIEKKQKTGSSVSEEQARLRLLYLAVDEHEKAVADLPKDADAISRFWESECRGLSELLNGRSDAKASGIPRIEEAANHFQEGLDSLRRETPIRIRKILFTEAPAPFGLYTEKTNPISAGDQICIYAELENVISKQTKTGEDLSIACSWEITDPKGKSILPLHEQECKTHSGSKLRDIVLNISVNLPEKLLPGEYTFHLTVSDRNNPKDLKETRPLGFRIKK